MVPTQDETIVRRGFFGWLRVYLLTGLLVLTPSAVTLWVFFRLLNWMDNLLGRYLRFAALDYHRVPGLGLLATLLLLTLVGLVASWIGARPLVRMWDMLLTRIPGIGIVYGSTKSLGEAFLNQKEQAFRQVVLVPWPHPGMWRVGFITGRPGADVRARLATDVEVVFVPHTPNPASGFVHYVPRKDIVYLDWPIEDGLKVIVSGGVVQPETTPQRPVAPIDLTKNLQCPVLGLFGNEDRSPSPAQVDQHEEALQQNGKTYMFHRYDGAGHGFFYYYAPSYRQQQAMDGWDKVEAFFDQYLG